MEKNAQTLPLDGVAFAPGDAGYEEETAGYNRLVVHEPELVIGAASTADVVAAVDHARQHGLSIGVMNTGHGVSQPATGVMVTTARMSGLWIDPEARTATVEPGVRGADLVAAAADHGLAPLNGSSPGVGVVGFTVGGGVPLLGRMHGYAADRVRELQLVTAGGQVRTLTRENGGDLFWAVLGGKDNFGIVTRLVIDLLPIAEINGGGLWWTGDDVGPAVREYIRWSQDLPDELATSVLIMRMPDIEFIPAPIRGQYLAHVRLLHLGDLADASELVAPMRAVPGIVQDTFATMPYREVASIHNEPDGPVRFEARNSLLGALDDAAVDALLGQVGPDSGYLVELRHLRGRLEQRPRQAAVGRQDGHFTLYSGSTLGDAPRDEAVARQAALHDALAPWSVGGPCPSFLSGPDVTPEVFEQGFEPGDHTRLRQVKAQVDPDNLFRVNFNVLPAD